jgi:hypothetical protein
MKNTFIFIDKIIFNKVGLSVIVVEKKKKIKREKQFHEKRNPLDSL